MLKFFSTDFLYVMFHCKVKRLEVFFLFRKEKLEQEAKSGAERFEEV